MLQKLQSFIKSKQLSNDFLIAWTGGLVVAYLLACFAVIPRWSIVLGMIPGSIMFDITHFQGRTRIRGYVVRDDCGPIATVAVLLCAFFMYATRGAWSGLPMWCFAIMPAFIWFSPFLWGGSSKKTLPKRELDIDEISLGGTTFTVRSSNGPISGIILGLIFFSAGVVIPYAGYFVPARELRAAASWQQLNCTILESYLSQSSRSGAGSGNRRGRTGTTSVTTSAIISYQYEIAGKVYRSKKIDFTKLVARPYSQKKLLVEKYRPKMQVPCFANPASPADSVLIRDFAMQKWIWGAACLLILFGAVIVASSITRLINTKNPKATPKFGAFRTPPHS